jgi:hypothetical protein
MRLVLDQGVPRDAAAVLRRLGHDCMHVGEIGMNAHKRGLSKGKNR